MLQVITLLLITFLSGFFWVFGLATGAVIFSKIVDLFLQTKLEDKILRFFKKKEEPETPPKEGEYIPKEKE